MALFFTLEKSCGNSTAFLRGCYFPSDGKVTKGSPGDAAIGRAASRPVLHVGFPPDPRYRGRIPGNCTATPARVVQLIDCASAPLPLAGQFAESPVGWTWKARRLPPAVGAGADLRADSIRPYPNYGSFFVGADVSSARSFPPSQTTWHKLGGPDRSGKPKYSPRQGPVARKERRRPLKFCPPVETTSRRSPTKNGVLVPLPPRAKEPAAGAAELFPNRKESHLSMALFFSTKSSALVERTEAKHNFAES